MSEHTITLDEASFRSEVLESRVPVLVDFWAEWCGPCKALAPTLDSLAADMSGQVKVGKADVDANQSLAAEYGVLSIPTLVFFKDGQQVDRLIGQVSREAIEAKLTGLVTA